MQTLGWGQSGWGQSDTVRHLTPSPSSLEPESSSSWCPWWLLQLYRLAYKSTCHHACICLWHDKCMGSLPFLPLTFFSPYLVATNTWLGSCAAFEQLNTPGDLISMIGSLSIACGCFGCSRGTDVECRHTSAGGWIGRMLSLPQLIALWQHDSAALASHLSGPEG